MTTTVRKDEGRRYGTAWNGVIIDNATGQNRTVWRCSHEHSHQSHETKTLASAMLCAGIELLRRSGDAAKADRILAKLHANGVKNI